MISDRIEACYDSHVHWAATGEFAERLRLESLQAANDIRNISRERAPLRGGWLLGFGWNESKWPDKNMIHRSLLDEWVGDIPVLLTRIDGHVGWANTLAMKQAGWLDDNGKLKVPVPEGGRIDLDEKGEPNGILVDKAYDQFLNSIPKIMPTDLRRHLLKSVKIFHSEGFTHIRDVGGSQAIWQQAILLDRAALLNLAVEMFFHVGNLSDLEQMCDFVAAAKTETTPNLRAMGIKIFLDGALGSEGAWISQPYKSGSGQGLKIISVSELESAARTCWQEGLELAVHTIGDQAAHVAVEVAHRLQQSNIQGKLHLEHAQLLRPDTIELMRSLNIICHLQPCHWLSDRVWMEDKIGELTKFAFPWRKLQESGIAFDFGSDTPIEPPSVKRNIQALQESAEGHIPKLLGKPEHFMSHTDRSWAPNSFTVFEDGRPVQVVFRGDHLI